MTKGNRIFETHIHLSQIENELEVKRQLLFETSFFYLNIATSLEESRVAVNQANKFERVFAAIGIHPVYLPSLSDKEKVFEELERIIKENKSKVLAIGECGLDFYKTNNPEDWKLQEIWFRAQIELSIKYKLPLVLHLRHAYSKALEILAEYSEAKGIIHSFDGNLEELKQFLNLKGEWFISFSPLIFRNFSKFRELIKWIDLERILVESDSPYLAQNQTVCRAILGFISEIKKIHLKEVREKIFQNSLKILQLNF